MIKLANIPVGKSINAFEKNFTVLEHTDEGTLVLSDYSDEELLTEVKRGFSRKDNQ